MCVCVPACLSINLPKEDDVLKALFIMCLHSNISDNGQSITLTQTPLTTDLMVVSRYTHTHTHARTHARTQAYTYMPTTSRSKIRCNSDNH